MSVQKLGQVLEKPCVHSRGLIFSSMIMKLGENVCRDQISDEFENGSCRAKIWVNRSNLRKKKKKKTCVRSRGQIFSLIIMNLDQHVCLHEISDEFGNRSYGVKNLVTRSNLRKNLVYALATSF